MNNKKYIYYFSELYNKLIRKNKYLINFNKSNNWWLKKIIGLYYINFHSALIMMGCFVLLFSNNILYIFILLNIIFVDIICIIVLKECPLVKMEKQFALLKFKEKCKEKSMIEIKPNVLNKFGLEYKCNHYYEMQLDFIVNLQSTIFLKFSCLLFYNLFLSKNIQ